MHAHTKEGGIIQNIMAYRCFFDTIPALVSNVTSVSKEILQANDIRRAFETPSWEPNL